jgi:hypothetical protein
LEAEAQGSLEPRVQGQPEQHGKILSPKKKKKNNNNSKTPPPSPHLQQHKQTQNFLNFCIPLTSIFRSSCQGNEYGNVQSVEIWLQDIYGSIVYKSKKKKSIKIYLVLCKCEA